MNSPQLNFILQSLLWSIVILGILVEGQKQEQGHHTPKPTEHRQQYFSKPLKFRNPQQQQQQQQQQYKFQQQEGVKQKIVESKSVVDFETDRVKYPGDVFGTYRGRWLKLQNGNILTASRLVMKHFGVVVYQVRPKEHSRKFSKDKNVVELEGELILRQRQYITDYDLKLPFEGVYIPKTGKFHAIIQPKQQQQQQQQINSTQYADKIQQEEARKKSIREGQTHIRQKNSFTGKILQQCQFRIEMTAGELEDMLVLVQMPVVITDDEVDWGQLQKKHGKEKNGKGVYMEGRFYSPNCHLELLVNGRTFYLQQQQQQQQQSVQQISSNQ